MSDYDYFMKNVFPFLDYDNQVRYQERLGILMDSDSKYVPASIHWLAYEEVTTSQSDNSPTP